MKKLGFIGCGNLAEALLAGALKSGFVSPDEVIVHTKSKKSCEELNKKYGVAMAADTKYVIANAKIIILGIKPNIYKEVINSLRMIYDKEIKIVRAMPNIPSMVG